MSAEVLATVDFQEVRRTIEGRATRHLVGGEGPTLVFLHGRGGLRRTGTHDLLLRDHRVVLIELPGFAAGAEEQAATLEEYAAIVRAQVTDATGGQPYVLVGTSFGGRVAVALAEHAPERMEGLVLLAPAALLPEGLALPGTDDLQRALVAHPERARYPLPDVAALDRTAPLVSRFLKVDQSAAVQSLSVPTLVAFGTADRIIPPTMGRHYVSLNPSIYLIFFYDSGHIIESDRPESLANLIRSFAKWKHEFHVVRDSGELFR